MLDSECCLRKMRIHIVDSGGVYAVSLRRYKQLLEHLLDN